MLLARLSKITGTLSSLISFSNSAKQPRSSLLAVKVISFLNSVIIGIFYLLIAKVWDSKCIKHFSLLDGAEMAD
jgi:hypothetical protein